MDFDNKSFELLSLSCKIFELYVNFSATHHHPGGPFSTNTNIFIVFLYQDTLLVLLLLSILCVFPKKLVVTFKYK